MQNSDFSVKKSLFFYQPSAVPGYRYNASLDWGTWASWNREVAYKTDRAYNYVHVAATYWALYRAGRANPGLLKGRHKWEWYLDQAYGTIMRCVGEGVRDVLHSRDGLMGETVFGEVLKDLKREGKGDKAVALEDAMRSRARNWDGMAVPFGSEMAWDSTGHEGVWYWSKSVSPLTQYNGHC